MMCAGWIRFRASLMAMRRTSWIDHRINDGVALIWLLPWLGDWFFLAAAVRDGGSPPSWRRRASPWKRGDASHARICSRCSRARTRSWRSQKSDQRQPLFSTCMMPLMIRRSSCRSTPRTSVGKRGSIRRHCSSLSQNKFLLTIPILP